MLASFAEWWTNSDDRGANYQRVLVICLVLVVVAVAVVGVPRLRIYGHDAFVSLDGGWRVLNGQRPVVDFYAQMGPLYYLLHAAGLSLAGNAASGLGYGSVLMALLTSAWSFLLLRGRMAPAPFFLTCLALVFLAVAPFPLGHNPWRTTFSMRHDRYGFAFTGLVLLECFLPTNASDTRRKQFAGGFSSGLACGVLLFLKISYGLVGLFLCAVSLFLRRREGLRIAGLAAGFAVVAGPVLAYLRFDLRSLLREYSQLAIVRSQGLNLGVISRRLYQDRFELAPVMLLTVLTSLLPGVPRRRALVLLLAAALSAGAGELLLLTNTQDYALPLNAVMALLLLNETTYALRGGPPLAAATLLAFGTLAVAIPLCLDASGLVLALGDKLFRPGAGYRLDGEHLAALEFLDVADEYQHNDNGQAFVSFTNEGLNLARSYGRADESVRGMGMSNPFSYGLLRRPSRGGAVNISATNVSVAAMPPLERLIGDVDLLLVPKFEATERPVMRAVLNAYPELLRSRYAPVAESANWKLYRRAATGGTAPHDQAEGHAMR
jgi:hypothetical protein